MSLDATEADRKLGIGGFPVFELTERQIEVLRRGVDLDEIREVLHAFGLLDFIFPSPRDVALGVVERIAPPAKELSSRVTDVVQVGHPLAGESDPTSLAKLVRDMRDQGLVAEVNAQYVLTEPGRKVRTQIKLRPQEAVISKLVKWAKKVSFEAILKMIGSP